MSKSQIERNFQYHPPKPRQCERCQQIRAKAKELALLINDECPDSRERSIALTHLETTVMWANAAIARNETQTEQPASGDSLDVRIVDRGSFGGG